MNTDTSKHKTKLFNPSQQKWSHHFTYTDDATQITSLTVCGRANILALQLKNPYAVTIRQARVSAD